MSADSFVPLNSFRQLVPVLGVLAAACSGDPYERYASAVRTDVDAAMHDAFTMSARMQLTVVHNRIPDDSFAAVARTVTRAARDVRARAVHFARVTPPPDLAESHAGLSAALTQVADALEALGGVFRQCAAGSPCQAPLDSVSKQFEFVGEDLHNGRQCTQRLLLRHGVMLR